MKLSQFFDLSHEFDKLTQVNLCLFFCLFFMRLSRFHNLRHEFDY